MIVQVCVRTFSCVCVCVCARARARVCVCAYAYLYVSFCAYDCIGEVGIIFFHEQTSIRRYT